MTEYEKMLDKMYFVIGSTLMDNDICRKGIGSSAPLKESEILQSNRRAYMNLKIMMLRLEHALYGEKNHEEDETEISHRDTRKSNDTESRRETTQHCRIGDFSC